MNLTLSLDDDVEDATFAIAKDNHSTSVSDKKLFPSVSNFLFFGAFFIIRFFEGNYHEKKGKEHKKKEEKECHFYIGKFLAVSRHSECEG